MKKSNLLLAVLIIAVIVTVFTACNKDVLSITYTINFNTNGGNDIASIEINSNTNTITMPSDPTKEGFEFDGWFFDNDTFNEPVSSSNIFARLNETTTSITLYAKWVEVVVSLDDAKLALQEAIMVMYMGTNGKNGEELSAAELARMNELIGLLEIDDEELRDKLYSAMRIVQDYEFSLYAQELLTIGEDYPDLSPEQYSRFKELVDMMGYWGGSDEDYLAWADQDLENIPAITLTRYNQARELMGLVQKKMNYERFVESKENFEEKMGLFINSLTANDVRSNKLNNMALFLMAYDYDDLMIEKDGYFNPHAGKLVEFIFDLLNASGFTSDDTGAFLHKLLLFSIESSIEEIEESLLEYADMIADLEDELEDLIALQSESEEYGDDWYYYDSQIKWIQSTLGYYQDTLERLENSLAVIEVLQEELSLEMVTILAEAFMGVVRIISDNDVFNLIFNASNSDEMPTISEIAVVIASVKDAMEDISLSSYAANWTTISSALSDLIEIIADGSGNAEMFTMLSPILSSFNPFEFAGKIADVLDVLNLSTLNVFLIQVDDKIDLKKNEYLFDNLAILEAKLIIALTGNSYDQGECLAAYNSLMDGLYGAIMPILIQQAGGNVDEEVLIGLPIAYDFVVGILRDKVVLTDARYAVLQSLSALNFVTSGTSTVTENMFNATVIINGVLKVELYKTLACELVGLFADTEYIESEVFYAVAGLLYAFDIDIDKLESYIDYLDENLVMSNNEAYMVAQLINALFVPEVDFADEDILVIINTLAAYGAEFGKQFAILIEFDNEALMDIIELLADNDPVLYDTIELLLNTIKIVSAAIVEIIDPVTGQLVDFDTLIEEIKFAFETFNDIYADDTATLYNVLDTILIVVKEVALVQSEFEELPLSEEFILIIDSLIREAFGAYGLDGTIEILTEIADELLAAGGLAIFESEDEQPPKPEMFIFLARAVILLAGDGVLEDLVAVAGEENVIEAVLEALLNNYALIEAIAAEEYDTQSGDFQANVQALMEVIMEVFDTEE